MFLESIDWDCEVKTLFREENLGCGKAVSTAINWFFENEESGIILEDDTVPDQTYFQFCEEMLTKYKDDDRIAMVAGCNLADKESNSDTYYFSKYAQIWGWATWRRAWSGYDYGISLWSKLRNTDFIYSVYPENYIANAFKSIFDKISDNLIDTWDYQWLFHNLINDRKTIVPCCNLVSNIGFSKDATHTFCESDPKSCLPRGELFFPLKHPISYSADIARDRIFLDSNVTKPKTFIYKIFRKIYRILKKMMGVK
jgi:hypothetical protein